MAKPKGSEKIGGRKVGTPNKTTAKAKELIFAAIDEQSVDFNKVMGTLKQDEPKEWAKIMVKLMDFVLPKKIDVTSGGEKMNIPISTWADGKEKS